MKRKLRRALTIGAIGLASLLPMKNTQALDITADNSVHSKYVGFGMEFGANPVHQIFLGLDYKNLSLGFFGNKDLKTKEKNELDFLANLNLPLSNKTNVSLGYSDFNVKEEGSWDKIHEVNASVDFDVPFSPSISANHFFNEGTYVQGSVSHDFPVSLPLAGKQNFSVSETLGYNDHAFRDKTGFSHLETSVSIPMDINDNFSITPVASYSHPLASDMDPQLCFGATGSFSFSVE